jgi:hypothetical protein
LEESSLDKERDHEAEEDIHERVKQLNIPYEESTQSVPIAEEHTVAQKVK